MHLHTHVGVDIVTVDDITQRHQLAQFHVFPKNAYRSASQADDPAFIAGRAASTVQVTSSREDYRLCVVLFTCHEHHSLLFTQSGMSLTLRSESISDISSFENVNKQSG